jgi:aminopeptidase N
MKKNSFILIFSSLVCVIAFYLVSERDVITSTNNKEQPFVAKEISPGSKSIYHLSLKMGEDEAFKVEAGIDITNVSDDNWGKLVMYFIPNMFTKENAPELENPASVHIQSLHVNGRTSDYSLEKDTLTLPLSSELSPGENIKVKVVYEFTLPKEGLRFTKEGDHLHLAQWYPMVPTYRKGWNKQDYQSRGETYHTTFSDFHLEVEAPPSYKIVSSSDEDDSLKVGKEVAVKNEKEIFLALLKDARPLEKRTSVHNVNVRVFGSDQNPDQKKEVLDAAVNALDFFQRKFGGDEKQQFDVIIGGLGMEYPNVVTVGSIYDSEAADIESLKRMVVHEVAHQWFYGMVSNDPYDNAWLDEGLAEIARLLYDVEFESRDFTFDIGNQFSKGLKLPVNLPLNQYPDMKMSSYIYGKSSTELGMILKKFGGKEAAQDFLKEYIETYQFKEIDTIEFVRFTKHYFNLENNKEFEDWLDLSEV